MTTRPLLTPATEPDAAPPALLERALPLVRRAVRHASRRSPVPYDEGELLSEVLLRLVVNDYAVLRKFRGESRLSTYLRTFVSRVLLDQRVREWGKWRPSSRARRMGGDAEALERLVLREHLAPLDAIAVVAHRAAGRLTEAAASEIYAALRPIPRRRLVPLDAATERDTGRTPDDPIAAMARRRRAGPVCRAMRAAVGALSRGERRLLWLRFYEGWSVADVARMTGIDQKRLYRRYDQVCERLRRTLTAAGVDVDDVRLLGDHFDLDLRAEMESGEPSAPVRFAC
jgi:RNA polymerase sigma factor for flagellar operon FliA